MNGKFDPKAGTVPTVSVEWYGSGGFFDRASLIGVGEAGPEVNIPLAGRKMKPYAKAVADNLDAPATGGDADEVIAWLASNLPRIIATCTPVTGKKDYGRMARSAVAYR